MEIPSQRAITAAAYTEPYRYWQLGSR